jgi:hypothetical protein
MPVPGAHVLQVAQASLPAATLKEPLAHAVHTRSDVAVAAALRYMPASHTALTDSQAAPSLVLEYVVMVVAGAAVVVVVGEGVG